MPPTYYEWAKMLICEDEGERLLVYDSATGKPIKAGYTLVGNPTIGYGRDLALRGIMPAEMLVMLHGDLAVAERAVRMFLGPTWERSSNIRRAVLMDMAHDLGAAQLVSFCALSVALLAGDWEEAGDIIRNSEAALRAPRRYERLARMMASDAYHPA